jgi:phage FluMu protein Com
MSNPPLEVKISMAKKKVYVTLKIQKPPNKPGYAACLACGNQLSYCGKPFTLEIACPSCRAVNVYEDSQQPVRIKAA